MSISEDTIRKTADLAHLELTDSEVQLYLKQLSAILDYVSLLQKVKTDNVVPMITATEMPFSFRDDVVKSVPDPDELLKNAPDRSGRLFKVPPVL